MINGLKRNWHHLLFLATMAGVVVLAYVLVGVGLDPAWQAKLDKFPDAIGALIGPFFGLVALMFGALYNAKITRDRDDRLREQETRALAAALAAEMNSTCDGLGLLIVQIRGVRQNVRTGPNDLWCPDFPVFNGNIGRIGSLGAALDDKVVNIVFTVTQAVQYTTRIVCAIGFDKNKAIQRVEILLAMHSATFKLMKELYGRAGLEAANVPAVKLEQLRAPHPASPDK